MNKKRARWILCLAAPLLLLLPLTPWSPFQKPFRSLIIQPQKTGITTLHFYDAMRERPLVTELWYPVESRAPAQPTTGLWIRCDEARDAPLSRARKKYPLIVMSHGHGADRYNLAWLAEILAANGYIVAAMDHYGNTWNNKIAEASIRAWERPKDLSFVIDQLLEHALLKERIDEKRIGCAGYSLGGATSLWIAGARIGDIPMQEIGQVCLEEMPEIATSEAITQVDFQEAKHSYCDARISAVFAMAPALGLLFDETSLRAIKIPVYIIATAKDTTVPMEKNARIFAKRISQSTLKVVHNEAGHYVFLNRPSLLGKRMVATRFCEDPASVDRGQIHRDVGREAVTFFGKHLNPSP